MKIVVREKRSSDKDHELYEETRSRFAQLCEDVLCLEPVLHAGNVEALSTRLRELEIKLAEAFACELSGLRRAPRRVDFPACQSGQTCVPHSVANALICLGEPRFGQAPTDQRAMQNHLIDDFLQREPSYDGGERRSIDQVDHYFDKGFHRELGLDKDYDFKLTGRLIDMVYGLVKEDSCALFVSRSHCLMAFGICLEQGRLVIEVKDPLVQGVHVYGLGDFARRFAWSPLGGLPYATTQGATYTSAGALDLVHSQSERGNRGVLCTSGLLTRV